ncbi:MAG: hypothetical protein IPO44_12835 [Candidatus Microthrix sp.]|nr:hypothetical protein [Candidatus Microthrix sp.]
MGAEVCLGGSDEPGDPVVLLVGDSHAAQWIAAFSEAGRSNGFAVALRYYGNCPAAPLGPSTSQKSADYDACASFQKETVGLLANDQVSAVVMTDAGSSRRKFDDIDAWSRSARELADAATDREVSMGLLVTTTPTRAIHCNVCRDFSMAGVRCRRMKRWSISGATRPLEIQLVDGRTSTASKTAIMCSDDPCPIQVGGTWVAARDNHLAREFTELQSDRIGNWVDELLRKR